MRLRMPPIWAEVSRGLSASISPATPATCGLAMLVPVIADPALLGVERLRGDDLGSRRRDVRLLALVARRSLAARDVDPAVRLVQVRDGHDARAAGERADRRRVDERPLGEERWERPGVALPDPADAPRVVPLDPAVEAAVAHLVADQPDQPLPGHDAHDGGLPQLRAQVDGDQVRAVRRVVELVVDAEEASRPRSRRFSMNSYGFTDLGPVAVRRLHLHREAVLGAVPDLELVLGEVDDPVADDVPLDVVHELARRDAAARVDAAEDPAGVVLVLGTLLAGVPGRDADAAARARERRVDPAGDRARVVVRVAVRAEADVDRDRLPLAVGDGEQVVDRVGEPRRVVERPAPVELVLRNRDQDRHDPGAAADAAVSRRDARDVRAVGAGGHLRLRLQHVRGQALAWRRGDRRVEVGGDELGAVVERRGLALGGRRPGVAALVPDREEPRLPVRRRSRGARSRSPRRRRGRSGRPRRSDASRRPRTGATSAAGADTVPVSIVGVGSVSGWPIST